MKQRMKHHLDAQHIRLFALIALVLTLMACQPIPPVTTVDEAAPTLTTYTDPNGFFTVDYPSDWVAQSPIFDDMPLPHAGFGTNQAIMDASMVDQPLPTDEIGVAIMLMPRDLFAEAGISAETPLAEVLPIVVMGMSDDPAAAESMVASLETELISLADGTPAARATGSGIAEDYVMTFAEVADGIYLFASQIQAVDYHNAALEAQVEALVNSFQFTGSADAVMGYVMAQMGAMEAATEGEAASSAAPTVTFSAVESAEALSYDGPTSIASGLTRIEFVNPGTTEHGLWLVKLDEGKTVEEFLGVMASIETDPQMPDWMAFYGGLTVAPGQDAAYTIDLVPGNYAMFSFSGGESGEPDVARGMMGMLEVTQAEDAANVAPPAADLRAELVDFSFVLEGEPAAGMQVLEVTNTGMEAHEMVWLKLEEGVTLPDVLEMMMSGEMGDGPPPFEFGDMVAPLAAGLTAWYEFDLSSGTYGWICFIPSIANEGAPHFMLGMTGQIEVP